MLKALAALLGGQSPPTTSIHRLGRGLPGYLILFAPHAFVQSASVLFQQVAFAMSIPLDLYGFYPYTKNSTYLSHTLGSQFQMQFYG